MDSPLFSVVIPAHNRAETLARVLRAYESQRPADLPFEVIVVDDGSTDGTADLLARWGSRRFRLRFAVQANQGPARARNQGLTMAQGPLVLFTGDDIVPAADLLGQHLEGHRSVAEPGAAVLGLTCWPAASPVTSTMAHVDGPGAQQFSYQFMSDGAEYDFRHFYTSNVSLRRELMDVEPGGFSTDFPAAAWEDAEYAYRLSRHGMKIFYRAAAVAFHHHPYDVRGFFRRQVRCGEMATILYRKHPHLERWTEIRKLEWVRLRLASAADHVRHLVDRVAPDLERWEHRIQDLAAFFDSPSTEVVDTLLHPLFRYAYLKGVAGSAVPPDAGRRLCAALFLVLVPPSAVVFARLAARRGLPCPRADLDPLVALAHRLEPG